jgi:hypothetical protein
MEEVIIDEVVELERSSNKQQNGDESIESNIDDEPGGTVISEIPEYNDSSEVSESLLVTFDSQETCDMQHHCLLSYVMLMFVYILLSVKWLNLIDDNIRVRCKGSC